MGASVSDAAAPADGGAPESPSVGRRTVVDRNTSRRESVTAARWKARGIVRVDGDVRVGVASIRGTVVVGGSLTADRLEASGSLEVRGPIEVREQLQLRGELRAGGAVRLGSGEIDGIVSGGAEIAAMTVLRLAGAVRVRRLAAGLLRLRGSATVPETVTARSFDAAFTGDTELGDVRGDVVSVAGPPPNPLRWALGKETTIAVRRIEAESVELTAVRAAFVRSPSIRLGPAAHLLAYEGRIVRSHPSSRVGPESWSRPPPGLRR